MKPHLPPAAPAHTVVYPAPRVLIVDDAQVMRLMLTRVLHRAGFVVETAENGQAGLDRALAHPPDLVLMDVTMPVMNGWEATQRMRSHPRLAHIPVVMLSCGTQPTDVQYAAACGAHSYLTKPVAAEALVAHLRAVLAAPARQTPVRQSLSDCCLLLVDDGGALRDQVARLLAELGCKIVSATSGAEAVWLAREHQPDLILMDHRLPFARGGEAARQIRAHPALRHTPILALSPGAPTAEAAHESGVNEYIAAPYLNERLLQRVVAYLVDRILDATRPAPPVRRSVAA